MKSLNLFLFLFKRVTLIHIFSFSNEFLITKVYLIVFVFIKKKYI